MSTAAKSAARLAHDVGKYVGRTARNIRGDDVPAVLVDMLAKDLFELGQGERASAVFAARRGELDALADARLDEVEALLAEADALEKALRAGAHEAVSRGAEIALRVEELLRAVARDAGDR